MLLVSYMYKVAWILQRTAANDTLYAKTKLTYQMVTTLLRSWREINK